jgi:hypothetical protein
LALLLVKSWQISASRAKPKPRLIATSTAKNTAGSFHFLHMGQIGDVAML